MAFDFTCTNCGKDLRQDKVLFDLLDIIAAKEFSFKRLKLRLFEQELESLLSAGKYYEEEERSTYKKIICTMPFAFWVEKMAARDNLNLPDFARLTREQLEKYAAGVDELVQRKTFSTEDYSAEEIQELKKEEKERVAAEAKKLRESDEFKLFYQIVDLPGKAQDKKLTEGDVSAEFAQLRRYLNEDGSITMVLRKKTEKVEGSGEELLVGLEAYQMNGTSIPLNINMRRCPHCGKPLFKWAGTARQRSIVFIGSQKTGKTSTILALAHYLLYSGDPEMGEIWANVPRRPVTFSYRTDDEGRFDEELAGYPLGYAPLKTMSVEGVQNSSDTGGTAGTAYSVTLKLTDARGRVSYLSMMDIPGEICDDRKDDIDVTAINDHFNVVYSSEAYVLCMEHPVARYERRQEEAKEKNLTGQEAEKYARDNTPAARVCGWVSQIQQLRSERTGGQGYVPMMLLFTKDPKLENSQAAAEDDGDVKNRYLFKNELATIQNEDKFNYLLETLGKMPDLTDAFRASLRCSPFGYKASAKGGNANQAPSPKNVHLLAHWILYVTACVPVPLDEYGLKNQGFYIDPPERRSMLPDEKVFGQRMSALQAAAYSTSCLMNKTWERIAHVAMSRCILFENSRQAEKNYSLVKHTWVKLFNAVREAHKNRDAREKNQKAINRKGG